jgi:hypothetical protein
MQFLNGLDFPIQVVIQSRKMNIDKYLFQLAESEKTLTNDLLKKQIHDYRDFVKQLVQLGEIMQKRFFVVVPLNPANDKQKGFFQRLTEIFSPSLAIHLSVEKFQKQKFDLSLRVSQITSGLSSMSLAAVPLDTQSLIELFYTVYNPELQETQRLVDVSELQLEDS